MNEKEILETIKGLSNSNGSYGSLYKYLSGPEGNSFLEELTNKNIKDVIDLIMYLEDYG